MSFRPKVFFRKVLSASPCFDEGTTTAIVPAGGWATTVEVPAIIDRKSIPIRSMRMVDMILRMLIRVEK